MTPGAIAPQFSFVLNELTTHSDETVNICVERDYSLFNESAGLSLYDGNHQMINDASQSLLFAGGVTQVCFDYTVPEQTLLGSYLYMIDGLDKYLKMMVERKDLSSRVDKTKRGKMLLSKIVVACL